MKYANFFIEELFTLEKGKVSNAQALKEGTEIAYVGAKYNNNGVIKFCQREESKVTKGNCIVFICDGEGSMGLSFYKKDDFMGTVNVTAGYNENLTPNIGMYISTVANTVRGKYNFGYKRKFERLKRETLRLPVDENGAPDWTFMEDYVQIKSNQIKDSYQLPRLHEITDFRGLDEVEWAEFLVSDYFDVNKPQKNPDKPLPYISAKKDSNGYNYWAHSPKNFYTKNTISWNKIGDGGGGLAYYHQYDYSMDDINCMSIKSKDGLEKYSNLFIVRMLSQYFKVFTHGHPLTKGRFMRSKMMLPAKDDKPDFAFMEQYMKRLENEVMRKWK